MNITLWACVPLDNISDALPQATWQQIEVESWAEWRCLLDFHGIIRWEVISIRKPECQFIMPYDVRQSLEDSEMIAAVNRVDGAMRANTRRSKEHLIKQCNGATKH